MSTLLFLSEDKTFDQFIPSHYSRPSTTTTAATTTIPMKKPRSSPRTLRKKQKLTMETTTIATTRRRSLHCHPYMPPSPTTPTSLKKQQHHLDAHRRGPSYPSPTSHNRELMTLEDELDYTEDALATLNVMFRSLRQAYMTCKPQLDPRATRLDAMEKELLSAYDDLELQAIHLDRHIRKLESSWQHWKVKYPPQPTSTVLSPTESVSSSSSSSSSSLPSLSSSSPDFSPKSTFITPQFHSMDYLGAPPSPTPTC